VSKPLNMMNNLSLIGTAAADRTGPSKYKAAFPRVAFGLAGIAMTVITIALSVILPAKLDSGRVSPRPGVAGGCTGVRRRLCHREHHSGGRARARVVDGSSADWRSGTDRRTVRRDELVRNPPRLQRCPIAGQDPWIESGTTVSRFTGRFAIASSR
jgi:hypothetical protein